MNLFARKTQAPTATDSMVTFRKALIDAIRSAHEGGIPYWKVAEVLEEKARIEMRVEATSSGTPVVRYDALTLKPIV